MEEMESNLRSPRYDQRDGHMAQEICPVCNVHFWMYPLKDNSPTCMR
ncbi:hypothetical protein VPHD148_0037 [Vibrio phage D148]